MLDAWIGNTDRHHENWGFLCLNPENSSDVTPREYLLPSFDHASSLGRELLDNKRKRILSGEERGVTIEAYLSKCRSAFYGISGHGQTIHPLEAFREAARSCRSGACVWLEKLKKMEEGDVRTIVERVPTTRMSEDAKTLALDILNRNARNLVACME